MLKIDQPTAFFVVMLAMASFAVAMQLAYFAVRRARYFLHWSMYVAYFTLSILAIRMRDVLGSTYSMVFTAVFLLAAMTAYLVGCHIFIGSYRKSFKLALSVYSVLYLAGLGVVTFVPAMVPFRITVTSAFMAAGHGMGAFYLNRRGRISHTLAGRSTMILNDLLILSWLSRSVLSAIERNPNPMTSRLSLIPNLVIGLTVPLLLFSLVLLSQRRMWGRLLESESALDRASYLSSNSLVYNALTRELGSPLGNARLAMSHIIHEPDTERKDELARQALMNIEKASTDLDRFSRLMGSRKSTDGEIVRIADLLESIVVLSSRSEELRGIDLHLESCTCPEMSRKSIVRTRPDILFHGIITLLETAELMNWFPADQRKVAISCSGLHECQDDTAGIRIYGVSVPPSVLNGERDALLKDAYRENRPLAAMNAVFRSMEELLEATIEIDRDDEKALIIELPLG